jgi:hypothetical protein
MMLAVNILADSYCHNWGACLCDGMYLALLYISIAHQQLLKWSFGMCRLNNGMFQVVGSLPGCMVFLC